MWTSLTGTHYYHSNWSYLSVFVNHSMASRSDTILPLNQNPILHNMVCRTLTIKLRVSMERKCVLFHSQNGDVDKLYLDEKPDKSEFDEVCVFGILYCIKFETIWSTLPTTRERFILRIADLQKEVHLWNRWSWQGRMRKPEEFMQDNKALRRNRLGIWDHSRAVQVGCFLQDVKQKGCWILSNKRLLEEAFALSIVFHFSVLRPSPATST